VASISQQIIFKGFFGTQEGFFGTDEGFFRVLNYNEKGFFDNFKLFAILLI